MFPWLQQEAGTSRAGDRFRTVQSSEHDVHRGSARAVPGYADSLAQQVEEKRAREFERKRAQRESEFADERRVERERAELYAEAQGEIQKQRDREARVAEREAMARSNASQFGRSRQQKVDAFLAEKEHREETEVQAPPRFGRRSTPQNSTSLHGGGSLQSAAPEAGGWAAAYYHFDADLPGVQARWNCLGFV